MSYLQTNRLLSKNHSKEERDKSYSEWKLKRNSGRSVGVYFSYFLERFEGSPEVVTEDDEVEQLLLELD